MHPPSRPTSRATLASRRPFVSWAHAIGGTGAPPPAEHKRARIVASAAPFFFLFFLND